MEYKNAEIEHCLASDHLLPTFTRLKERRFYHVGPSVKDNINGQDLPGILYDYDGNPISATDTTRVHTNKDAQGLTRLTYTYGIKRREL